MKLSSALTVLPVNEISVSDGVLGYCAVKSR
jgi:hypothetical protein